MKLYELADKYRELLDAIDAGEIDENAIEDTLEAIGGVFDEKIEQMACMVKEMDRNAENLKAEAAKISERAKRVAKSSDRIKEYMAFCMRSTGKDRINTVRAVVSFRRSERLNVTDEAALRHWLFHHDEYLNYKDPEINRYAIKLALKDGMDVPGAEVATFSNIQIK